MRFSSQRQLVVITAGNTDLFYIVVAIDLKLPTAVFGFARNDHEFPLAAAYFFAVFEAVERVYAGVVCQRLRRLPSVNAK